jgi:probable HAF family extracellular repeat protein
MRSFLVLGGVISALVLPLAAAAAPLYEFLDLGTLGGSGNSFAHAVNDLGQVVGESVNAAGQTEAFRTAPNLPIDPLTDGLGFVDATIPASVAEAINNQGWVVGFSRTPSGQHAFFTGPGQRTVTDMGTLPSGVESLARAINNSGQIAGSSGGAILDSRPFRTSSPRAIEVGDNLAPNLTGVNATAYAADINDAGQVVISSGRVFAYRTTPGGKLDDAANVGTLRGQTTPFAINNRGQVVGTSGVVTATVVPEHAFRTGPDAAINPLTDDLGTLGGRDSVARDVNDAGVVVGGSAVAGNVGLNHAFVYIDGEGMLDLNARLAGPLPAGWSLALAEGINNSGQIVGWAYDGQTTHAFLLTPVPEPAFGPLPLSLLALGGRALWRCRRSTVDSIRVAHH